jgi:Flp pilus assembly pilin Flp
MFQKLLTKLWNDDGGIVFIEYLLLATIVALGLIVGLAAIEAAANVELTELSNGILAINQSNSINSQGSCIAFKGGWSVFDTPTSVDFTSSTSFSTSIDEFPCP